MVVQLERGGRCIGLNLFARYRIWKCGGNFDRLGRLPDTGNARLSRVAILPDDLSVGTLPDANAL
jgi:hypothetical protein